MSTAGNAGTSALISFVSDMRLRAATATVRVAGTTTGHTATFLYFGTAVTGFNGTALSTTTTTATLGTIVLSTSTAGSVFTIPDSNARLVAGGTLGVKNGTDATGTYKIMMEMNLDPLATWTGP